MNTNYGDVALNLAPDWDRNRIHNQESIFQLVGHKDGVADAYVTERPADRHQFFWIEKKDQRAYAARSAEGFRYVTRDEWTINETLWEWNAAGHAQFGIEELMFRPASMYFESRARRQKLRKREEDREREAEAAAAERAGITITDDHEAAIERRKVARRR